MATFGVADLAIALFTIVFYIGIVIFFAIRARHSGHVALQYFLGGRDLGAAPVSISLVVGLQSSLLILSVPAETYLYGLKYSLLTPALVLAFVLGATVVVPIFHPLKVTSVFKYLKLRFRSNLVRFLAVSVGMLYCVFYISTVAHETAVALKTITRIPVWATLTVSILITALYTAIGGIQAVVWTNVFQFIVMVTGVTAVLTKSTIDAGGVRKVLFLNHERLQMFDFRPDPAIRHSFWAVTFGSVVQCMFLAFTQTGVQRVNSTPRLKSAKILFYAAAPLYIVFFILLAFEGLTIFAYYSAKQCDIFASGRVEDPRQVVPYAVADLFQGQPGMTGLCLAAICSASFGCLSTGLCSLSAITYTDVIQAKFPIMRETKATNIARLAVLVYGLIALVFAFIISSISDALSDVFICFMRAMEGPMVAMFLLAIFFKRATSKGVFIGTLCGILVSVWLAFGYRFSSPPPPLGLPLGPTSQCVPTHSIEACVNFTLPAHLRDPTTPAAATIPTSLPPRTEEGTDHVQQLYSISNAYLSLMGAIVTLVLGFVLSVLTTCPPRVCTRSPSVDSSFVFTLDKLLKKKAKPTGTNGSRPEERETFL